MAAGSGRVFKVYVLDHSTSVGSNDCDDRPTLMSREGLHLDPTEIDEEYFIPRLSLFVRKVGPPTSQPGPTEELHFNA